MKTTLLPLCGILLGLSLTSLAQADTIVAVNNPSFEDDPLTAGTYTNNSVMDWTPVTTGEYQVGVQYFSGTGQYDQTDPLAAPADGDKALYLQGYGGAYQDLGALAPDATYTLTLAVGQRSDISTNSGYIEFVNGTTDSGTVLEYAAADNATPGTFTSQTVSFTTDGSASGDLTIVLGAGFNQIEYDNLKLSYTSTVPEPSVSVLLLAGGLVTVLSLRARRRTL